MEDKKFSKQEKGFLIVLCFIITVMFLTFGIPIAKKGIEASIERQELAAKQEKTKETKKDE